MNNTTKSTTVRNIACFAFIVFVAFVLISVIGMLVTNPFFAVLFALVATAIYWKTGAGRRNRD